MEYNCLNLPRRIQSERGDLIEYTYDAAGQKLRTVHTTVNADLNIPMGQTKPVNSSQTKSKLTTDYCGNITYVNGKLDMIRFEDGYIKLSGGTSNTYFYMKDHLGNNRKVVSEWGSLAQQTNYYPSGMVYGETNPGTQPYKYSDKKLDRMHGLDMYDSEKRFLDMQIPRFTTMDPLAEKYYSISPYAYCANNFVNAVDLRGDSISLAGIQRLDQLNNTQYTDAILNDLQAQTGLTITVSANGVMSYATDSKGNPVIATTTDSKGNTVQVGSDTARDLMTKAIDHKDMVNVNPAKNSGVLPGTNNIGLGIKQIEGFINGTFGIDNSTMGFGMTLMHELHHTPVGGELHDTPGNPGPVVTQMNIIRAELNTKGGNYGQRVNYKTQGSDGANYIPFNNATFQFIKNTGVAPANRNAKYIKY